MQLRTATLTARDLHRYAAFGLTIVSELPLPELYPASSEAGAAADIRIRLARFAEPVGEFGLAAASPMDAMLTIRDIGRYRIRGGAEIDVEPDGAVSARNLRLFLLGSAFGVLFHQRGLFPLHANAIVSNGSAVAFGGASGIGKSTLAAYFQSRGWDVLCDDVCVISFDAEGRPLAWPGLPRLKLWQDAAHSFGYDSAKLERIVDKIDKYHVPLPAAGAQGPFPLARIYILQNQQPGSPSEISRLSGSAALEAIVENIYRREYLATMGLTKASFERAARVAQHATVFSAPRQRGYDVFEREVEKLEHHFRENPDSMAEPDDAGRMAHSAREGRNT